MVHRGATKPQLADEQNLNYYIMYAFTYMPFSSDIPYVHLKGIVYPKMKILAPMLFQTCMTCFLWQTKNNNNNKTLQNILFYIL